MTVTLKKHPTVLLNKIGSYVCQAIIYIQQQQPELLLDKYRNISWRDNSNQSRLKAKLIEVISDAQDWESLIDRLEAFIKALLISDSTNTPVLIKLQEKIRHLNPNIAESDSSSHRENLSSTNEESNNQSVDGSVSEQQKSEIETTELKTSENQEDINYSKSTDKEAVVQTNELKDSEKESSVKTTDLQKSENQQDIKSIEKEISTTSEVQQHTGIVALLLDAENIQITSETEDFLEEFFNNSIQIKVAFANWHSMGHKDIEFHQRGYDLIHLPRGKDNADDKMIAFGSIIDESYPKVKEVLVCSSDKVMTNLSNQLQQKGLTVYQVSQENSNLTILNGNTDESQTHIVLPSIDKLLSQIKDIIQYQEKETSNQWIKLSKICKLFKDKYSFGINKVVSHHLPGKTVKNIFANMPEFVIHQIPEHPEVYVTLFKMPSQQNIDSYKLKFDDKPSLEKALINIVTNLVGTTPNNYIPIYTVGERFDKQYGKGISKILKELNMSGNFLNFLQSCSCFELKKTGNIWQVALK